MRFVIFTHSLVSDWNHGNAHFLRGIATELGERGHEVRVFEPCDGWSLRRLIAEQGEAAVAAFQRVYPKLRSTFYDADTLDVARALSGADVVVLHEWNTHDLVRRIGDYRREHGGFRLFFHDTHHRSATDPQAMAAYDLRYYDGVLAYGSVIRDLYRANGWARRAWTWHEAADTRVFRPHTEIQPDADLVWIGNWGDDERSHEIREFLIEPAKALRLRARVYGVRYPREALDQLDAAGIEYGGWLPNYRVPEVFARHRVTVHIPRGPYVRALPAIPTIRPFEALACGIPMISAPWNDCEQLFRPGVDFLVARDRDDMISRLRQVLSDQNLAARLRARGIETIRDRHTCAHRVDELMAIIAAAADRAAEGAH